MEIVSIEKEVFEKMVSRFKTFVNEMEQIHQNHQGKTMGEWVDNQDVCFILNISPRTLQSYRDSGKIGFSKINHKVYYKLSDIQAFIEENRNTE